MDFLELMNSFKSEDNTEEYKKAERTVYCPKCKSKMIQRKSRPGLKSKFWYGCSSYPKCKSIVLDINLKDKHYIK